MDNHHDFITIFFFTVESNVPQIGLKFKNFRERLLRNFWSLDEICEIMIITRIKKQRIQM